LKREESLPEIVPAKTDKIKEQHPYMEDNFNTVRQSEEVIHSSPINQK
jgi:hypothetical protein